jgi:hypothetical protein
VRLHPSISIYSSLHKLNYTIIPQKVDIPVLDDFAKEAGIDLEQMCYNPNAIKTLELRYDTPALRGSLKTKRTK